MGVTDGGFGCISGAPFAAAGTRAPLGTTSARGRTGRPVTPGSPFVNDVAFAGSNAVSVVEKETIRADTCRNWVQGSGTFDISQFVFTCPKVTFIGTSSPLLVRATLRSIAEQLLHPVAEDRLR